MPNSQFFPPNKFIKKFLEKFWERPNPLVPSLLFWGEKSTGKTTTAYYFAQALLCSKSPKVWGGCGKCDSCQMFRKNVHPDLLIVKSENSEHNTISIKDIRGDEEQEGVINFLSYHPQLSSYRVVIIEESERMTLEAQNAFLKTLEEPNPYAVIILISHHPQKLLPTILSRVISLRFTRASTAAIKKYLIKQFSLPEKEAENIAVESGGRIGEAIRLTDKNYQKERESKKKILKDILSQPFFQQSIIIEKIIKESQENPSNLNELLTLWLRMLIKNKKFVLAKMIFQAYETINSSNVNKQLLLENILLQYKYELSRNN